MANCARCNAPLKAKLQFCTHCGAPVAAVESFPKTPPPTTPTVKCPKCAATTPADRRFCSKCGWDLSVAKPTATVTCPKCRRQTPEAKRYCVHCGYDRQSRQPVPDNVPTPRRPAWRPVPVIGAVAAVALGLFVITRFTGRHAAQNTGGADQTYGSTHTGDSTYTGGSSGGPSSGSSGTMASLSGDQKLLKDVYGNPDFFSVTLADDPSGKTSQPVRLETWAYPKVDTRFVFLDGKFSHTTPLDKVPEGATAPKLTPEQFDQTTTPKQVEDAVGEAAKTSLKMPEKLAKDSEIQVYAPGVITAFSQGQLVHLETVPVATSRPLTPPPTSGVPNLLLLSGVLLSCGLSLRLARRGSQLRCDPVTCSVLLAGIGILATAGKGQMQADALESQMYVARQSMANQVQLLRNLASRVRAEGNEQTAQYLEKTADQWSEKAQEMDETFKEELLDTIKEGNKEMGEEAFKSILASMVAHSGEVAGLSETLTHTGELTFEGHSAAQAVMSLSHSSALTGREIFEQGMHHFLAANLLPGLNMQTLSPDQQESLAVALVKIEVDRAGCSSGGFFNLDCAQNVYSQLSVHFQGIQDEGLRKIMLNALYPDLTTSDWEIRDQNGVMKIGTFHFVKGNPATDNTALLVQIDGDNIGKGTLAGDYTGRVLHCSSVDPQTGMPLTTGSVRATLNIQRVPKVEPGQNPAFQSTDEVWQLNGNLSVTDNTGPQATNQRLDIRARRVADWP